MKHKIYENCAWCGNTYERIRGECMCPRCLIDTYGKDFPDRVKKQLKKQGIKIS